VSGIITIEESRRKGIQLVKYGGTHVLSFRPNADGSLYVMPNPLKYKSSQCVNRCMSFEDMMDLAERANIKK
jgi:hypothetical protein